MYMHKRTYVGNKWQKDDSKLVTVNIPQDQTGITFPTKPINNRRICEIEEEVAYWRKANAIHAWIVANVQDGQDDCKEYDFSTEKLKELLDVCRRVLAGSELVEGKVKNGYSYKNGEEVANMEDGRVIKDPSTAMALLPTERGFFFGGTDYDEYYLDDIKYTAETIEALLAEDADGSYSYRASW